MEWKLNKDVNLLSGINGSEKTTLLDTIVSILYFATLNPILKNKIKYACIELTGGI